MIEVFLHRPLPDSAQLYQAPPQLHDVSRPIGYNIHATVGTSTGSPITKLTIILLSTGMTQVFHIRLPFIHSLKQNRLPPSLVRLRHYEQFVWPENPPCQINPLRLYRENPLVSQPHPGLAHGPNYGNFQQQACHRFLGIKCPKTEDIRHNRSVEMHHTER